MEANSSSSKNVMNFRGQYCFVLPMGNISKWFCSNLFWERRDFHVSFSGRDTSGNVWNRPSRSSMFDMGISSNIMKSTSPKFYMPFWDIIIYSCSDISSNCDLITELDLITVFDVITLIREVSIGHLQSDAAIQQRTLTPPDTWSRPITTCICSNVETILSWTCHVYVEFRTSLGTSILLCFTL